MTPLDDTTQPATTGGNAPAGPSPHDPPPGARFMNLVRWGLFAFLLVLAAVSIGSYVMSKRPAGTATQADAHAIWQCPMHPSYTSDKPGECPICGMSLERVEVDDAQAHGAQQGDVPGLTSVRITPERVQLIGVRTARVERTSAGGRLDLVGFVTPDESRLRRVHIRVSGWVRQLYANEAGMRVTAGQPLLALYSPELYQTEQEYLIARGGGMAHMGGVGASGATGAGPGEAGAAGAGMEEGAGPAAARLRLLGVPEEEIHRLEHEGKASDRLVLRAPSSGTVLERGVVEGQYVGADTPLLTLADLSRVWVMADLYEMDITRVHVGDAARFTVDALPGRSFAGRIEFVYPTVSNETRTLKARVVLGNDGGSLRPGMYGRVAVESRGGSGLSVPGEAVVRAGEHSYVFLAHAGGRFEPRLVWTGTSQGDRIQVLKGVAEGDTVVSSASFLIDSESRLKAAIAGMGAQPGSGAMPGMDHGSGGGK
jgi:Cu(I)/Ag(I) efflux system membrane fusion protein